MPTKFNPNNLFDSGAPDENDDALWELLSVYADGEATPEEAERVEALLRSDPAYARQFEFLRLTSVSAQSYIEVEPPAALRDAIFAATIRKQTFATRMALAWDSFRHSLAPRYVVPLAGVAAAALLAAAILPRLHSEGAHESAPDQVAVNAPSLTPELGPTLSNELSNQKIGGGIELPHVRSVMPSQDNGAGMHLVVTPSPGLKTNGQMKLVTNSPVKEKPNRSVNPDRHDKDEVQTVVYAPTVVPMMDALNQRALAPPPVTPSEGTDGPDVKLPEFAAVKPNGPGPNGGPKGGNTPPSSVKIMYAKLPSVGPDPKQILTRADLERRRTALTDGYDRSTIRSMERKETTFSFFKGSF